MKKRYQCLVCGRLHDSEEEAKRCHNGPVQAIVQEVRRWPKSLLGAH